ncbi:hypothetical protein KCU88_g2971, partial [Aureobasidium melanogenum]
MIPWSSLSSSEVCPDWRIELNEHNLSHYVDKGGPSPLDDSMNVRMLESAHERRFAIAQLGVSNAAFEAGHRARIEYMFYRTKSHFTSHALDERFHPDTSLLADLNGHDVLINGTSDSDRSNNIHADDNGIANTTDTGRDNDPCTSISTDTGTGAMQTPCVDIAFDPPPAHEPGTGGGTSARTSRDKVTVSSVRVEAEVAAAATAHSRPVTEAQAQKQKHAITYFHNTQRH